MLATYRAEGPTHLQIEPTTRCNFTCKFCAGRHMAQGDLSFENFKRILDQLPTLRYIHLQGEGEPLLNPEFFSMARYAREKGLVISMITNGSLLHKEAIKQIIELEFQWVGVSLESSDSERFRMIRGGLFEKVIYNVNELVRTRNELGSKRPDVSFAVTVLASTFPELDKIVELSDKMGLNPPHFQALQAKHDYTRHYTKELMADIPPPEMAKAIRALEEHLDKRRQRDNIRSYFDELSSGWQGDGCPYVGTSLYVEYTGDLTPCCMIKDHNHPLVGNALKQPINTLWHAPNRININTEITAGRVPDSCRGCFIVRGLEAREREAKANHAEVLQASV